MILHKTSNNGSDIYEHVLNWGSSKILYLINFHCMYQITTFTYTCLINWGFDSNCDIVIIAIYLINDLCLITFSKLILFAHLAKLVCMKCYIYWPYITLKLLCLKGCFGYKKFVVVVCVGLFCFSFFFFSFRRRN